MVYIYNCLLPVSLFFAVLACNAKGVITYPEKSTGTSEQYVCPPCSCSGDKSSFSSPGKCNHCSMQLMKLGTGISKDTYTRTASLFQNAKIYSQYYIRIIYPLVLFVLIFSVFVLVTIRKNPQSFFFSLFGLSLSLYILKFQLYGNLYAITNSRVALFAPISFLLWVWPSLFFFLKYGTSKKSVPVLKHVYKHYLPGLFSFLLQLVMLVVYPSSVDFLYNHFDSYLVPIEQVLFVVGGFFYGRKIIIMNRSLKQNPTIGIVKNKRKFRIFIFFIYLASSVMGAMLVINFTFYNGRVTALDYHPAWFLLAAFIPWFYYDAWRHMLITNRKISLFRSKYESSSLRDKQVHEIKEKLEGFVIGKQAYLNPELTLRRLAENISVKPHHLSRVINQEFKLSFTDYINLLRLEEATSRLKSPKYTHLKISAISYDCGFNSVPTFNTLFKKVHKVTPSRFRKNFQELT